MPQHETLRIRTPPAKDEDEGSRTVHIKSEGGPIKYDEEIIVKRGSCFSKVYNFMNYYLIYSFESNRIRLLD